MERDDETYGAGNEYDFGDRIYSPRLGRWLSIDPMQQKYPDVSPYNFSLNSPISLMDPNGRWVKRSIKRYDGDNKLIPAYKFWVKAKTVEVNITIHNAKLYKGSSVNVEPGAMNKAADDIQRAVENRLSGTTYVDGQKIVTNVKFNEPIEVIQSLDNVKSTDNLYYLADREAIGNAFKEEMAGATVPGTNISVIDINNVGIGGGADAKNSCT